MVMSRKRHARVITALGVLAALVVPAPDRPVGAAPALQIVHKWTRVTSGQIVFSSPNVANIGGKPTIVVGDRLGRVLAYRIEGGTAAWPAWPRVNGPVDSTPSVLPVGSGGDAVFVGAGNAAFHATGGYSRINPNGQVRWSRAATNLPGGPAGNFGVQASLTVGRVQGVTSVMAGSLGQTFRAFRADNGATLPGFPWLMADSNYSTAALANVEPDGSQRIVFGGDSSDNPVVIDGKRYTAGGHMRVLRETGRSGGDPNDGLLCERDVDQIVQSSPAIGRLGGRPEPAAVFGTGDYGPYAGGVDGRRVVALNIDDTFRNCPRLWTTPQLDAPTQASPALANLFGDGKLHVVIPTKSGRVYALNGATGGTLWTRQASGQFLGSGSVVTADLRRLGRQDVIVATTAGVQILDGATGSPLASLHDGTNFPAFQNSPLVTRDPNGRIGITVAGYNGQRQGVIQHYQVVGSDGSRVRRWGAWPVFHHDPQLTGNAGTPPSFVGLAPTPDGEKYRLARSDGRVFLCAATSCAGPKGDARRKIVGIAPTPSGLGYWLADTAGRVYAGGDAKLFGSVPARGIKLTAQIVDIAATPSGNGYWLVGLNGRVFAFGNAVHRGDRRGQHLNQFIVAITPTPSGQGYWLAGSDGGVFTYNAKFLGSTGAHPPPTPVIAMARTPGGKGYWLVTVGGRVFRFGTAGFYGDKRGLPGKIIDIAASPTGRGYWLLGIAGRVFKFGDAKFHGSGSM
jgi:outer membrane protein assembly factor BamB